MLKRIINPRSSVVFLFHTNTKSTSDAANIRHFGDDRFNSEEFKHWIDWRWKNYAVSIDKIT